MFSQSGGPSEVAMDPPTDNKVILKKPAELNPFIFLKRKKVQEEPRGVTPLDAMLVANTPPVTTRTDPDPETFMSAEVGL